MVRLLVRKKRVPRNRENILVAVNPILEIVYCKFVGKLIYILQKMMKEKPLILITNDDGISAKGIKELTECLRDLGELVVFAPDGPRSGMGSSITSLLPLKYKLVKKEKDLTIYSCTGTPADCVKLAVNVVLDRKPDMLVSGINHGGNFAICVIYSGTMGAAAEGCIFDIPSFGVSLLNHTEDPDFSESCRLARMLARRVLREKLPRGTYLNLNVPDVENVKGVKVCRQTPGKWIKEFKESENASGEAVYWLSGEFKTHEVAPDNDMTALDAGYASLVPCKIDLTDFEYMITLNNWDL